MNGYDQIDTVSLAGPDGGSGLVAGGRAGEAAAGNGSGLVAGDTPAGVAARLTEHHRRRRTLFDWMHPLRLAGVPYAGRVRGGTGEAAVLAEAFLDDAGMPMPPFASFSAPGAALALLPVRECLAVFRLRALLDHSDEVHSWIDRPRRRLLDDWIGPRGARLLLARRRELSGDAMPAPLRAPLGPADADTLAWRGFRLFERECGWAPNGPLAVLQFAMPANAASAQPAGVPAARGWSPSLSIVSQLPDLFPEWSW